MPTNRRGKRLGAAEESGNSWAHLAESVEYAVPRVQGVSKINDTFSRRVIWLDPIQDSSINADDLQHNEKREDRLNGCECASDNESKDYVKESVHEVHSRYVFLIITYLPSMQIQASLSASFRSNPLKTPLQYNRGDRSS